MDLRFLQHPHKLVVENNVFDIPQRLKAIDPSYFVVFNSHNEKFEIHSSENKGISTYCFTIPYPELDCRTIELVKKGDMRTRGDKYFKELYEEEIKKEKSKERAYRNEIEAIANETRSIFNGRIIV